MSGKTVIGYSDYMELVNRTADQDAALYQQDLGTGEYWAVAHAPTPAEQLDTMRARILALAARLEQPMTGMGNGDVAKRLREIAERA